MEFPKQIYVVLDGDGDAQYDEVLTGLTLSDGDTVAVYEQVSTATVNLGPTLTFPTAQPKSKATRRGRPKGSKNTPKPAVPPAMDQPATEAA
jgi:hypothetical protein